ncbi:MAG: hypothetical protein PF517_10750 [Salinivirgaceae bacterium]|jgi:hypothetical protein|nr:hypothetical protein [Salinivirgaceae bacterium]
MKIEKSFKYLTYSIGVFLILLNQSCLKDETETSEKKNYTKVSEITIETSQDLFLALGQPLLGQSSAYGVDVYVYNYPINYKGSEIEASGLVCVPKAEGQEFPVLSFQHGTLVAHKEAPSVDYNGLMNRGVEAIASMGYVVVLPDEIGFGASSNYFHPYLIKEHISNSVIEMINSLQEYPDGEFSGVSFSDSLFLMGYSHGGWATMATLERMEQTKQDDWNIIATACGAGPYFPEMVKDYALSNLNYA